jgi:glycosyltransferase involved in cell wall biosynthesis
LTARPSVETISSALRILQLTLRIPYPLHDGGAIATYKVTEQLSKAGHPVVMIALNTKKHRQDPSVMEDICEIHTTDLDTTPTFSDALRSFLFGELPYNVERFQSEAHHELIKSVMQQREFDIVQLEGSYLCLYAETIQKYTRAPLVLRAHNVEYKIWERYAENEKNPFKRFYYRHLAKRGLHFERTYPKQCDGLISMSSQDAADFRQMGFTGNIESIPPGIDLASYPEPTSPQAKDMNKVGFLGSLEWMPNVQGLQWFLDYAWPLLRNRQEAAELHVAGRNPSQEVLNWTYPAVTIHGEVADAYAYLLDYPIVIIPLLSGSGVRIKLLEALALGRCVVSSKIGAEGLAVRHREHLMLAETPLEFAENISFLMRNPDFCAGMQQSAIELIRKNYDWPVITQRFEAFYEKFYSRVI